MSAAVFVDPFLTSDLIEAEVTVGGRGQSRETRPAWVSRIWRSGMLLTAEPLLRLGTLAWVDVSLPGGARIRPLVEVVNEDDGAVGVRYRHVFPDDRRRLETYHAVHGLAS